MTSSPPATTVVARPSNWANNDCTAGAGAAWAGGGGGGGAVCASGAPPPAGAGDLSRGRALSRHLLGAVAGCGGPSATHPLARPRQAPTTQTSAGRPPLTPH